MPNEQFQECLKQLDMKVFVENPAQALINAGVSVKKGVEFKFVETEEEANALPANVFPLKIERNDGQLSTEHLDQVAGGMSVDVTSGGQTFIGSGERGTVGFDNGVTITWGNTQ
jgi:hypothetical protein